MTESCHFNRLDPFTSAARENEGTGRIHVYRDFKIEVWPSYSKRQTAVYGWRFHVTRLPIFGTWDSRLVARSCMFVLIHSFTSI